ncbi:MAG: sugar phosphate isomerase/epimerase [Clostridia bacterium]|nr:sugar phosphate isomerase/epimerase [Clostridia bacterium]
MKLYCSTGALITSKNGRDYTLLPTFAQQLGDLCDGFEFMMYDSWYEVRKRLTGFLAESGLEFPTFHIEKRIGQEISREGDLSLVRERFTWNCEMAVAIGAKTLIFHLWDGVPSDRVIAHNIAQLPWLREIADGYGLTLTVENVVCNHADPLTHLTAIHHAYPDIPFTFDVKFAAFHDQLAVSFDEAHRWLWNEGAVRHIHISDYDGGYMEWECLRSLHPGEGKIDYPRIAAGLRKYGWDGSMTIESTSVRADGTLDAEKLRRSLGYLREIFAGDIFAGETFA